MHRDSFSSTKQLGRAPGTAPLPRATAAPTGELGAAALAKVLEMLKAALKTHRNVIELLYLACRQVPIPIPGVGEIQLQHTRTAKGDEIVLYLVKAIKTKETLPRRVQVAVFRFYDADDGATRAEAQVASDAPVSAAVVEQLRLKLFYLMHYHTEFPDDPVLSQLFPGPRKAPPPAPQSATERLRAKSKLQSALAKADILYHQLAPLMAAIRDMTQGMAAQSATFSVKDLLSAEKRAARLMSFRLAEDPAARELLATTLKDYEALRVAIEKAKTDQDPAGLEEAVFPLTNVEQACRQHPTLRELLKG